MLVTMSDLFGKKLKEGVYFAKFSEFSSYVNSAGLLIKHPHIVLLNRRVKAPQWCLSILECSEFLGDTIVAVVGSNGLPIRGSKMDSYADLWSFVRESPGWYFKSTGGFSLYLGWDFNLIAKISKIMDSYRSDEKEIQFKMVKAILTEIILSK